MPPATATPRGIHRRSGVRGVVAPSSRGGEVARGWAKGHPLRADAYGFVCEPALRESMSGQWERAGITKATSTLMSPRWLFARKG